MMRSITTFSGEALLVDCIGCEVARGQLVNLAAVATQTKHFSVHQDVEIGLPGFLIISSLQHLRSIQDMTPEMLNDFVLLMARVRRAQTASGFQDVIFLQNEDSADHFHFWSFPVHEWMREYGRGITLLANSVAELKTGKRRYSAEDVMIVLNQIRSALAGD